MYMQTQEKYKSFLLKFGYWAAIILIAFLCIKYLLKPFAPFIIALGVVMLVQPIVKALNKKFKINKGAASVILVILCYLIIAGLLALIIAGIVSVVVDWAEMFPDYFTNSIQPGIVAWVDNIMAKLNRINPEIALSVQETLPEVMTSVSGSVMNLSMNILSWASGLGAKLPGFFLATVICIISTVFLALDYDGISDKILHLMPGKVRKVMITAKRALGVILGKYLKSYAIILLMTFAELFIGFLIIGVSDAAGIAALIAVFDILPIVGSGIILAPWAIICFIQGKLALGIGLAILWAIVIVARQITEPKIVGKQVGMHPLATLVCLWVGLKLGGGLGMFALPISLLIILELKAEGLIFIDKGKPEEPELQQAAENPEN